MVRDGLLREFIFLWHRGTHCSWRTHTHEVVGGNIQREPLVDSRARAASVLTYPGIFGNFLPGGCSAGIDWLVDYVRGGVMQGGGRSRSESAVQQVLATRD